MTSTDQLYDEVMTAKPRGDRLLFGEMRVDVYPCVLQKGAPRGKVLFDPAQHQQDQRRVAIDLTLIPLDADRSMIERSILAESKDWTRFTLPSLKAVKLSSLKDLHGKFVSAQLVETGDVRQTERGEFRPTAFVPKGVFATEAEVQAARQAFLDQLRGIGTPASVPATAAAVEPAEAPAGNDAEMATAKKFLPALWRASGRDIEKFAKLLAGQPLLSRLGIGIEHPDVVEVIAAG